MLLSGLQISGHLYIPRHSFILYMRKQRHRAVKELVFSQDHTARKQQTGAIFGWRYVFQRLCSSSRCFAASLCLVFLELKTFRLKMISCGYYQPYFEKMCICNFNSYFWTALQSGCTIYSPTKCVTVLGIYTLPTWWHYPFWCFLTQMGKKNSQFNKHVCIMSETQDYKLFERKKKTH
jgi:hypothetical protein